MRVSRNKTKASDVPPLYIPIRINKLWGYADTSKRVVITPQFDAANPFIGKYAVVEKNLKAYAIDRTGKIVSPGFDQLVQMQDTVLSIYSNEESDTLGGWGICTISGRKLLDPAYDEIRRINAVVYAFRKDSLWGFVNINGTLLSKPDYDTAFAFGRDYLLLSKGNKIGLMRNDGKRILDNSYEEIYNPNALLFAAKEKKKFWGAVDVEGNAVVPFVYDTLLGINSYFLEAHKKDSLAIYFSKNVGAQTSCIYKSSITLSNYWLKIFSFKGTCGLADTNGRVVLPVKYREIVAAGGGDWFAQDTAKNWGLFAHDGTELIAPAYTRIQPFRGNITVAFKDNLQCLINTRGEILVPADDQQINIRGNVVKVLRPDSSAIFYTIGSTGAIEDKSGFEKLRTITIGGKADRTAGPVAISTVIDTTTGALLYIPPGDSLEWYFDADLGLWGMRNAYKGDILISPQFFRVKRCAGNFTLVEIRDTLKSILVDDYQTKTAERVGLVSDRTGKIILKPEYASINVFDLFPNNGFEGCVRVTMKGGQQALVSTDGNETITPFFWIDNCHEGVARFCIDGKFSIDPFGETITSVEKLIVAQNLNGQLSFGPAVLVKDFMERAVHIVGGKWGYIDSAGKILVAPQYDAAKQSSKKTGIVKQGKKWGLISMGNASILPFNYDALSYLFLDTSTYILAQNNGLRYGYIDGKGNIIVAADLRQSIPMGNGFIAYNRTGKWGVMNSAGQTVSSESYNEIQPYSEGLAPVRRGKLWGFIDTLGQEVIGITFDKVGKFSGGMAKVLKDHGWGYVNTMGTLLIATKYLQAGDFAGSSAPVKTKTGYGLISKNDKWLLKPAWLNISQLEGTDLFIIRNESASGLCRSDGKLLLYPKYEAYKYLGEGRLGYRAGLYWGMADTSGKTITSIIFDKILPFSEGRAAAAQNSLWGYINKNGRFIIAPQFRSASPFSENRAYVNVTGSGGEYIDTTGKVIFGIGFGCSGYPYSDGKALIVYLDDFDRAHYFYINRRGFDINRFQYDAGKPFKSGSARVCLQKQWGMVSFTGYYIVKPRFFQLDDFDHGLARFQLRASFGLYTLGGKEMLPVQYDVITPDYEMGMIRFERANSLGYLFSDARICWPETE